MAASTKDSRIADRIQEYRMFRNPHREGKNRFLGGWSCCRKASILSYAPGCCGGAYL
jgi:hypothetical protein